MSDEDDTEFDDENLDGEDLQEEDLQDEELEDEKQSECPYCGSEGDCEHMLLCYDTDEQSAQGGALFADFVEKSRLWETEIERKLPVVMREFVERLAREAINESIESGPGHSFNQDLFYCASAQEVKAAVERFRSAKIKLSIER